MKRIEITVDEDTLERLDSYLAISMKDISRSKIQKLIKDGNVLVNGKKKKAKYLLKVSDQILIDIPEDKKLIIEAQNIPLDIIYEDRDIAIINKAQDMIVHPASGNFNDTLVNAILYHIENLSDAGEDIRPGIVHRLDKDTSGLLVIAKNNFSYKILCEDFKKRKVNREYIALLNGVLEDSQGIIDAPIGRNPHDRRKMAVVSKNSKRAITKYEILERFEKYTLVRVSLETGRTHQIRVHFSNINHPIVGDQTYSDRDDFKLNGQLLHSIKLGLIHPRSKEYMEFKTPIPERFNTILTKIR